MPIVYSVNGFPTAIRAEPKPADAPETRYHDVSIDDLYASGAGPSPSISFPDELIVLETAIKAWTTAGNMFAGILQPDAVVSPSVASFVIETAQVILGLKKRRVMSFQDWALLLKPTDETRCGPLQINADARAPIEGLAQMTPAELFQRWVVIAGFEDLIGAMKIYVGNINVG